MLLVKKIFLSVISAFVILAVTWLYQNYDFSFSVEDKFFKKVFLWKTQISPEKLPKTANIVFINTGQDLALVEDTVEYGNLYVTDRKKLVELLHYVNESVKKPLVTVLDLQFYYPFTSDRKVDTLMEMEIAKNDRLIIPLVKDPDGNDLKPLYEAKYGDSYYETYNAAFNKFRILHSGKTKSIPVSMDEIINGAKYKGNFLFAKRNDSLCLSAIWPNYFISNEDVLSNANPHQYQFYNLGEVLIDLSVTPSNYDAYFADKILMIGNFQGDIHSTPVGKMSGPVLLANIYLSLVNRQHIVSVGLLTILLLSFSVLSYLAWFSKMPELKLNFNFVFSSYLTKFIRKYVSYFGSMFIISLIAIFFFQVQIALFLPAFIFAGIGYFMQKKQVSDPKKPVTVATNRKKVP